MYQTANLSYTIRGLQDNYQYYVRPAGRTVHGMEIDTGQVPIGTQYKEPSMFAVLNLENLRHDGSILIQSNIISILGTSLPSPPLYIDDKMVDLSDPGHCVKFEQGFNIQGDFTLQLIGQDFNDNAEILVMDNRQNNIVVRYMRGTFQNEPAAYSTLGAHNTIATYFITSNYILVPTPTEKICLWIRRVGDLYDLKAAGAGNGNCFERPGLTDYRGVLLNSTLLLKDNILYA